MLFRSDSLVPPELRMAYRVLKNAGVAPAEVGLRSELAVLSERAAKEVNPKRRAAIRARLAKVIAYLEIAGVVSPQTLEAYSFEEPPEPPGVDGV